MRFLPLVLANLKRHKLRTLLTIASVAVALFLFASLRSVVTTLSAGAEVSSASRMIVQNATSFISAAAAELRHPAGHRAACERCHLGQLVGGKYGDGKRFFAQFAIEPESYLRMYPEIQIPRIRSRRSCASAPRWSWARG